MKTRSLSGVLGILFVAILVFLITLQPIVRAERSTDSPSLLGQGVDAQEETAPLQLSPCTHAGLPAQCGMLRVPEDRTAPDGRKIDIRVVVIPASRAPVEPDPIFWLSGGPGVAATDDATAAVTLFLPLLRHRDLVLVDQRGVGGSHPLTCAMPDPSEMADPDFSLADYAGDCLANLDADPRFYTTTIAMDDVDEVRAALGYELINVYGGSYGATAAQVYLRNHEEHVRSVVLLGGSLLDVPMFELEAHNSQYALDVLFARCAADARCGAAYPNVRAEFLGLLERLQREPADIGLIDPTTNAPALLDRTLFTKTVHSMLLNIDRSRHLPRYIHEAHESGDLKPFAAFIQINNASALAVMPVVILCFDDWAAFSPEAVAQHSPDSYYTVSQVATAEEQVTTCAFLPSAKEQARYSVASSSAVPVLLVNGEADPQDPPQNVAGASQMWPNSLSVVLPAQGHHIPGTPCLIRIIKDFVEAASVETLDTACVDNTPVLGFDIGS